MATTRSVRETYAFAYHTTPALIAAQCMQFKAPAFRYLSALYTADATQASLYAFLQDSVLSLWGSARTNASGASLFAIDWAGPPQTTVYASQQNAAVTATNQFALLCED